MKMRKGEEWNGGGVGVDGMEGCAFERVRCGCGILTFLSRNGKSYRGKFTRGSL